MCTNDTFTARVYINAPNGQKNLIVSQTDKNGNTGQVIINVNRQVSGPSVMISSPVADSYHSTGITLTGTCTDGIAVVISGDGASLPKNISCQNGQFSTPVLFTNPDGQKMFTATQTDVNGTSNDSRQFNFDTTPPSVSISNTQLYVNSRNVNLMGTCESGLKVQLAGTGLSQVYMVDCNNGNFSQSVQLSSGNGLKVIAAAQTDYASLSTTVILNLHLDTVAPVVAFTSPANATAVKQTFQVKGSCENALPVILTGDLLTQVTTACSAGVFSVDVSVTAGSGTKLIQVSQTDAAGNKGSSSLNVTYQSTGPSIAITAPADNTYHKSAIPLMGACTQGLSIQLKGDGVGLPKTLNCGSNGQFSTSVTLTAPDGSKIISVEQTNVQGTTMDSNLYYLDTTAPKVTVNTAANLVNTQNISISGQCETGLAVSISGSGLQQASTATCNNSQYSKVVLLSSGDGNKNISVSQTDNVQLTGTATLTVKLDMTTPAIVFTSPPAGVQLQQLNIQVQGTCENQINVKLSGDLTSTLQTSCASGQFMADVTLVSGDGSKLIQAEQIDAANNKATASLTVNYLDPANQGQANFINAKNVLQKHCLNCHSPGKQAAFYDFNLATEQEFINAGYVTAGNIDQSKIITRTIYYNGPTQGVRNMPTTSSTNFSQADYDVLVDWVTKMTSSTPAPTPSANPYVCNDYNNPSGVSTTDLQRLNKYEYTNTMNMLFSSKFNLSVLDIQLLNIREPYVDGEVFGRAAPAIEQESVEAIFDIADLTAIELAKNSTWLSSVFGGCMSKTVANFVADPLCINRLLDQVLMPIYRRDLRTIPEMDYVQFYKDVLSDHSTLTEALKGAIRVALNSPYFIYKIEGHGISHGNQLYSLDAYEIATRLAYGITGTTPDSTLLGYAKSGQLSNTNTFKAEVDRLFASTSSSSQLNDFYEQLLAIKDVSTYNYTSGFLGGINSTGLASAAKSEVLQFTSYITNSDMTYEELFSSQTGFINDSRIASIYKVSGTGQINLPLNRAGLLTRVGFLAAGYDTPNIVHRGLLIRHNLLCEDIGLPDPTIVSDPNDLTTGSFDPHLSTRQNLETKTNNQSCIGCHAKINPPSFAFGNYDPLGRISAFEILPDGTQQPYDVSVNRPNIDNYSEPPLNGAIEFSQRLGKSARGPACLAKQYLIYSSGRQTAPEDECELSYLYEALKNDTFTTSAQGKSATILNMMKSRYYYTNFKLYRHDL
ncbi:MAG: DUF1592 domain-containing protein [Bdellovibrionales bacterium]|nr:DUF1592 domain-containing protein [Bdellovibrionales bacterium]